MCYWVLQQGRLQFVLVVYQLFWLQSKIKHQRILMHRKMNTAEVYVPSNAKNIIYYPIQVKKNYHAELAQEKPEKEKTPANTTLRTQKYKQAEVGALKRLNQELKQREEVYIDKLMKLEQGLQNQHTEFIKLQELYTQLFQSYKQKQAQIEQLQYKFRETERYRQIQHNQDGRELKHRQQDFDSLRPKEKLSKEITSFREQEISIKQNQWLKKQKQWKLRQNQLITMNETLTQKLIKLNQRYQKSIQEASSVRNKDKMNQSRTLNHQKLNQQIEHWQSQFSTEKQTRLKLQYQNDFLKNRNKDLEQQRQQLEQLVTYKQNQIAKLRHEKINIHRQSSQKMMSRSPTKGSRVALKTLQPTNNPTIAEQSENESSLNQQDQKNGQYFSFSREKQQALQEQLPSFPPQLQIESLIKVHKYD